MVWAGPGHARHIFWAGFAGIKWINWDKWVSAGFQGSTGADVTARSGRRGLPSTTSRMGGDGLGREAPS